MAQQDTISHFSHPGHELVKRHYAGRWLCDMCWEDLSGPAYGCHAGCDFAIHESCAGHPQTLSSPSPVHEHQLVLIQTRRDVAHRCDVCAGNCATGCFLYRCPPCGFDMHPRCAQLPQVVRSTRHPEHDLTLILADGRCFACDRGAGRAWYYRCTACNVDVHVSCAAGGGGGGGENAAGAHQGNNQQRVQDLENELFRARMEGQINASTAYTMGLTGWRMMNAKFGTLTTTEARSEERPQGQGSSRCKETNSELLPFTASVIKAVPSPVLQRPSQAAIQNQPRAKKQSMKTTETPRSARIAKKPNSHKPMEQQAVELLMKKSGILEPYEEPDEAANARFSDQFITPLAKEKINSFRNLFGMEENDELIALAEEAGTRDPEAAV